MRFSDTTCERIVVKAMRDSEYARGQAIASLTSDHFTTDFTRREFAAMEFQGAMGAHIDIGRHIRWLQLLKYRRDGFGTIVNTMRSIRNGKPVPPGYPTESMMPMTAGIDRIIDPTTRRGSVVGNHKLATRMVTQFAARAASGGGIELGLKVNPSRAVILTPDNSPARYVNQWTRWAGVTPPALRLVVGHPALENYFRWHDGADLLVCDVRGSWDDFIADYELEAAVVSVNTPGAEERADAVLDDVQMKLRFGRGGGDIGLDIKRGSIFVQA